MPFGPKFKSPKGKEKKARKERNLGINMVFIGISRSKGMANTDGKYIDFTAYFLAKMTKAPRT